MEPKFDSSTDTLLHIRRVNELVSLAAQNLLRRAIVHDKSKLEEPEKSVFDKLTPEFRKIKYGSQEYTDFINRPDIRAGIDHHHANNSHHPQYYKDGLMECRFLTSLRCCLTGKPPANVIQTEYLQMT